MGIPLVISKIEFKNEKAISYPYAILAKEKPIPFEYVDGLEEAGRQEPGPYQIKWVIQLN